MRRSTVPNNQNNARVKRNHVQEEIYDIPFSNVATADDLSNSYRNFFDTIKAKGNINGSEANLTTTFTTRADNKSLIKDLGTIAKGLIGLSMSYVNTRVFPLVYTNDLTHTSKVIEFIDAYATPTPYLGVSRTFAYREEQKISQSTRYGTHFFMEADEFNTPEGQEFFAINMERMVQIIQNTYIEVGWAALMRPHPYKLHVLIANAAHRNDFMMALQREVDEWAQSYKSPYAIRTGVQLYSRILRDRTGINEVVMIMPDDKDTLVTDPDINTHDKLGDRGVDIILGDGKIGSINGVDIYPALVPKSLDGPLDTQARIGRYHVFINRHRHLVDDNGSFNYEKFMIDSIFNINTNQRDHMNFKRCNEADGRWATTPVPSQFNPGGPNPPGVHLIDIEPYRNLGNNPKDDLFVRKMGDERQVPAALQGANGMGCTVGALRDYLDPKFVYGFNKLSEDWRELFLQYRREQPPPPPENPEIRNLQNQLGDLTAQRENLLAEAERNNADQGALEEIQVELDRNEAQIAEIDGQLQELLQQQRIQQQRLRLEREEEQEIPHELIKFASDYFKSQPQTQNHTYTVEDIKLLITVGAVGFNADDVIITREFVTFCYIYKIPPPWGFLLFQPFDGYNMQSQVFACSSAGQTNVTEPSFSMGQDPQNFSFHFGCVAHAGVHVFDEQRILIVPNQFYNGIVSGGNTTLIQPKEAEDLKLQNFVDPQDNISRPSIYVCSIPWDTLEEHLLNDGFLDITGKSQMDNDVDDVCHWPGAQFYGIKYGWNTIENNYSITGPIQPIARICYQLHAIVVNHTGTGMMDIEGQGHHGKYEEPGHRQVRTTGGIKYPRPSV